VMYFIQTRSTALPEGIDLSALDVSLTERKDDRI